jgi:D-tyrosyl-tRNA(Tyr) deacylase
VIALLQRVTHASVSVGGEELAAIGPGLLVLLGVEKGDTETQADRLLERLLAYRVFPDAEGRMNLDLAAVQGGLLLVPQFTLAADTRKGNRPSFTPAAPPEEGARLFSYIGARAAASHASVGFGRFGADMQVALVNDGPVTFWLQVPPEGP